MKKIVVLTLVALLLVGVYGCSGGPSSTLQSGSNTYTVSYMDLNAEVNLTGSISYIDEVNIYPKATGIVTKVYVSEGSLVKKSQKILEINSTQANTVYQNALAAYQNAQITYDLTLKSKSDLQNSVEQAKNNLEVAQASYDFAKANYDSITSNAQATDVQIKQATQQLKQAEAGLSNANIAVESAQRQLDNFSLKLEQAQINLNSAKTALDNAANTLKDYIVTSPIDGVVLNLSATENAPVQIGMPVGTVGNPKGFVVSAYVDEIDVPKLRVGESATITFDAVPDVTLNGKISFISLTKVTIPGGSAYKIKVTINSSNEKIKSGMSANVLIVTNSKSHVLAVPISSLTTLADGKTYVDKVVDENVERVEVETGIFGSAYVEVVSGLKEGDTILLVPQTSSNSSSVNPFGG